MAHKYLHFVVQRHKASYLHYDLRLEIGGSLKSWAIKKGPSMNPEDHRLAIMTTDHPLLYRFYRGIVPGPIWRGNKISKIGARIVEIWDKGYYEPSHLFPGMNPGATMQDMLRQEKLEINFHGKKLNGNFLLLKMKLKYSGQRNADRSWLLIKTDDEYAIHRPYDSETFTSKYSFINSMIKKEKSQ